MQLKDHEYRIQKLVFQRNSLGVLLVLVSFTACLLSVCLLFRSERIVVIPPNAAESFWVEDSKVSPEYLEQSALYFSQLILTKTPLSAFRQGKIVLRNCKSSLYNSLCNKLEAEHKRMKKNGTSYVFFTNNVSVYPDKMSAIVSGVFETYVKGRRVSSEKEDVELNFDYSMGRLVLSGISVGGENHVY